ncbi:MAG: hypothetical protein LBS35_14300 [Synergistaceae bacterium]|nr:hypothetical protein [Synergistaceae bacterium]
MKKLSAVAAVLVLVVGVFGLGYAEAYNSVDINSIEGEWVASRGYGTYEDRDFGPAPIKLTNISIKFSNVIPYWNNDFSANVKIAYTAAIGSGPAENVNYSFSSIVFENTYDDEYWYEYSDYPYNDYTEAYILSLRSDDIMDVVFLAEGELTDAGYTIDGIDCDMTFTLTKKTGSDSVGGCDTGSGIAGLLALALVFKATRASKSRG